MRTVWVTVVVLHFAKAFFKVDMNCEVIEESNKVVAQAIREG